MGVASVSIGARPLSLRGSATTLLVAVLLVATAWAVLAGGWTASTGSVVLVGLAGVVEGVLLARGRTPRLLALGAAPLLLFVSLLPTSWSTRPVSAAGGIGNVVAQYGGAAATGLLGNAPWEFNIGLGALLWVCGAWAAWFAVRERRGAIATGPCWAVIAVNAINAPSASRVTLPAAIAAAAAIMVIAAVHLDRLSDSWRQRRVSVLPGTDGRFAGAAAAGGVLIVLLALVLPPLSSTDISSRLFGSGSAGNGAGGRSNSGSGAGGVTVRFNDATIPGGALTLTNSPVLTYRSSLSTGVYLRMATDGVFDAGNWLPASSTNLNGDDSQEIVGAGTIPRDRLLSDGGVGTQQRSVSLTATMIDDTSDTNTLPFAGEPDSTSVAVRVYGLTRPEANGQLLTIDSVQSIRPVVGTMFTTAATESTASAEQLRHAGVSYPSVITRDFLDLRDDNTGGAAVIRGIAQQWTRTAANPYDKATTIESMLRSPRLFHYTLNPPSPSTSYNVWPLTYFLTISHSGYCQYFAAAMGAMLRAVGIPTRLVNGYGPGASPRAEAASRGTLAETNWTVASKDAHTWVEAYFPGYGWIPFEPTPPSAAGDYQPFTRGALGGTGPVSSSSAGAATADPTVPTRSASVSAASTAGQSNRGHAVLIGLAASGALLILMLALFTAWFLRPRDIRGVWRRVGIIGRLVGVSRDRSLTFDEYVNRITAALPADGLRGRGVQGDVGARGWGQEIINSLRDIAAESDRAFYASGGIRSAELARMKSAWRRVALLAPRLSRRAPVRPQGAP